MSKTVDVVLVLAGAYAGKNITLLGYRFFEGKIRLTGAESEVAGVMNVLGKCYQAYPEGSERLAAAQAHCAGDENGKCDTDAGTEHGADNNLQSQVQQVRRGVEEVSADDGAGAGTVEEGDAGSVSDRDGHEDAGIPVAPGTDQSSRVREALSKLDHNNDEHWAKDGKPRMDAVQDFYGSADVSRAAVDALAPGFMRGESLTEE